jgi:uncharacterized protein YbbC (DUF1343 family)
MASPLIPGIDMFLLLGLKKRKRYALVTNDAACSYEGEKSRVKLLKNECKIMRLFSPEHGITVAGADGSFQKNITDPVTGLPVISLYGEKLAPDEEDLADIDVVLFDIPDVGCRFYTYLWTMTYIMEVCAAFKKKLIILDRPNPISGNLLLAEGPMLDEEHCASFIGRWNIPVRHSCTLGELAKYFAATKIKGLDLEVIPVISWDRNTVSKTFTPTSPAIKNISTALLYPGMGLLEGINVNEGRGTDKPFNVCGAPWMNGEEMATKFAAKKLAGISVTPYTYTPDDGLYAGERCNGLLFTITDENIFRPVATGISLLETIISLYPTHITGRLYKTCANPSGEKHLDKLLCVQDAFNKIKNGEKIETRVDEWEEIIRPFLIYPTS